MISKKQLLALRACIRERLHELAAQIGRNRARAVLAALVANQIADNSDGLRELAGQIGERHFQALVAALVPLLREVSSSEASPPSRPEPMAGAPGPPNEPANSKPGPDRQPERGVRGPVRLRYLAYDRRDCLHRVSGRLIKAAWDCMETWEPHFSPPLHSDLWDRDVGRDLLRLSGGKGLRLVTVLLEWGRKLLGFYYLRVPLDRSGWIVPGARLACFQAQIDFHSLHWSEALKQMRGPHGIPADFFADVAVALDVPVAEARERNLGFGGPLALAARFNLEIEHAAARLVDGWKKEDDET